ESMQHGVAGYPNQHDVLCVLRQSFEEVNAVRQRISTPNDNARCVDPAANTGDRLQFSQELRTCGAKFNKRGKVDDGRAPLGKSTHRVTYVSIHVLIEFASEGFRALPFVLFVEEIFKNTDLV